MKKDQEKWLAAAGIRMTMEVYHESINSHNKITYESPYSDETFENIVRGFVTCMVGIGYSESHVNQALANYLEECAPEILNPDDQND